MGTGSLSFCIRRSVRIYILPSEARLLKRYIVIAVPLGVLGIYGEFPPGLAGWFLPVPFLFGVPLMAYAQIFLPALKRAKNLSRGMEFDVSAQQIRSRVTGAERCQKIFLGNRNMIATQRAPGRFDLEFVLKTKKFLEADFWRMGGSYEDDQPLVFAICDCDGNFRQSIQDILDSSSAEYRSVRESA